MHAGLLTIKTHNLSLNKDEVKPLNITTGDYIAISVNDTGSGMDEKTIQKTCYNASEKFLSKNFPV
ncbi:MAG: hypothetical protein QM504_15880 [Pseudomonadota bacterium]